MGGHGAGGRGQAHHLASVLTLAGPGRRLAVSQDGRVSGRTGGSPSSRSGAPVGLAADLRPFETQAVHGAGEVGRRSIRWTGTGRVYCAIQTAGTTAGSSSGGTPLPGRVRRHAPPGSWETVWVDEACSNRCRGWMQARSLPRAAGRCDGTGSEEV